MISVTKEVGAGRKAEWVQGQTYTFRIEQEFAGSKDIDRKG